MTCNLRRLAWQIGNSLKPASDVSTLPTIFDRVLVLHWAQSEASRSAAAPPETLRAIEAEFEALQSHGKVADSNPMTSSREPILF